MTFNKITDYVWKQTKSREHKKLRIYLFFFSQTVQSSKNIEHITRITIINDNAFNLNIFLRFK